MIRQGDILFVPTTDKVSESAKLRKSGIVAEGEATGHHHRIAVLEDAELYEMSWRGDLMLRVSERGVSIVHEEHHTVTLPPGNYKVHQAREFDYLAGLVRNVRD